MIKKRKALRINLYL